MDGGIFNTFFVSIHQSLITVPQTTYSTYALPLACHLLPVALTVMDVGIWENLERPWSIIHLFIYSN